MRLLLTSDTHLPRRAKRLPEPLLDELPRADVVFHAGDWVDTATLDLLESRSRRLVGVYGNNDGPRDCAPGCRRSRTSNSTGCASA
ncbi:hypothetical protein SGRIM128S_06379 [Streptomyces griseomycini]